MMGSIRAIVEINMKAHKYTSSIVLIIGPDHFIDVKSLLGLGMTLDRSIPYRLYVYGPDQREAKAAMQELFARHRLQLH